jgi:hypothetical protein
MTVEQLVPSTAGVEIEDVLTSLRVAPRARAAPFDPRRVQFSEAVSRAIFRDRRARGFPELMAAAFWLRHAAVTRLADRFRALERASAIRVPRGLAFHLPPTNVDTLFVYPLIASFLVGNVNIVRVSRSGAGEQVTILCEALSAVLNQPEFAEFADELAIVSYDHEAEPTAEISMQADIRLLWGGDATIDRLRAVPIAADAHELTFGDRFSFAVVRPEALLEAGSSVREALAARLFNDSYWFDQRACSSPRLLVWVGEPAQVADAREILWIELGHVVKAKGYQLQPAAAAATQTYVYGALIDRPIELVTRIGTELVVLGLAHLDGFDRDHPGGGVFFDARVVALSDLIPFVTRRDQTVTALGFSAEELAEFARALGGRGVDRIVRFGDALNFSSAWDGYDLLAELTRTVSVGDTE